MHNFGYIVIALVCFWLGALTARWACESRDDAPLTILIVVALITVVLLLLAAGATIWRVW